MGFRYRKSFKVAPGVKVNVGKRGVSATVGGKKGPHYTVNSNGQHTISSNLPVSGLSYRKTFSSSSNNMNNSRGVNRQNYSNGGFDNRDAMIENLINSVLTLDVVDGNENPTVTPSQMLLYTGIYDDGIDDNAMELASFIDFVYSHGFKDSEFLVRDISLAGYPCSNNRLFEKLYNLGVFNKNGKMYSMNNEWLDKVSADITGKINDKIENIRAEREHKASIERAEREQEESRERKLREQQELSDKLYREQLERADAFKMERDSMAKPKRKTLFIAFLIPNLIIVALLMLVTLGDGVFLTLAIMFALYIGIFSLIIRAIVNGYASVKTKKKLGFDKLGNYIKK